MLNNLPLVFSTLLLFILSQLPVTGQESQWNALLNEFEPRAIGPAGMGGRVTAIDVDLIDKSIIYIGTASGGIWKSKDEGLSWKQIFNKQSTSSIGAIKIDPNNSQTIWVGTGEGNPRNSQNSGNGVYLSKNGGETWQHVGLEETKNIHRIIIDPIDPATVYIGAQGTAWGASTARGIFKTTDQGESWEKILYVNEFTGIADMVIDPDNPSKIIAAMWQFRRWPWFFESGGEGSGLYVSFDAGQTWQQKDSYDGLPDGKLGRIGLAIAPSNTNVVYALVEAEENGLYRSDNGGENWYLVTKRNIGNRPFYYSDIFVDPFNHERIYNLWSMVTVSSDGGRNFRTFLSGRNAHSDHHAFWINPHDPKHIIDGNDGGLVITTNKGKTWRNVRNLPIGQFYHISVDNQVPYNVYGGLQDNGAWMGPAFVWKDGGIRNEDWKNVGLGDGFDVVPSDNERYGFSLWQGGNLVRYDTKTGLKQSIRPVHPHGLKLRWNWNTAFVKDPIKKEVIYLGSQFVHKSTDNGKSWSIISPDLTTNNPQKQKQIKSGGLTIDATRAENHTTITAIAINSEDNKIIWAGSDDGLIHVTQDAGKTWQNITPPDKICPKENWVNQLVLSKYNDAEAFVVLDNHRMNDFATYILHTENFGKTWKNIANNEVMKGYALSLWQDEEAESLLFAGLETGLYVSLDKGENWEKWPVDNFPTVPVSDMVLQPATNDLAIATFGRSLYIIDDISPLREWVLDKKKIKSTALHIFKLPDAHQAIYAPPVGSEIYSSDIFEGRNRRRGVPITFYLEPEKGEPMASVKITNEKGEIIRTYTAIVKNGLNRYNWELCRKSVRLPGKYNGYFDTETAGIPVSPGLYQVEVSYASKKSTQSIKVLPDPRVELSINYASFENYFNRWKIAVYTASAALDRLEEARHSVSNVEMRLVGHNDLQSNELKSYSTEIDTILQTLIREIKLPKIQGVIRESGTINDQISETVKYINSPYVEIGENHLLILQQLENQIASLVGKINIFFDQDWKVYKQEVVGASISILSDYQPIIMGAAVVEDDDD